MPASVIGQVHNISCQMDNDTNSSQLRAAACILRYGKPYCANIVLGTRRLDEGDDTITIDLLNRYLDWHERKYLSRRGDGEI